MSDSNPLPSFTPVPPELQKGPSSNPPKYTLWISLLHYVLFKPSAMFAWMGRQDLFRMVLGLQFFRWHFTAFTTMYSMYAVDSPMFFPPPFGMDPSQYRQIEVFAYGPYGLVIITAMAWMVFRLGHGHTTRSVLTFRNAWTLVGISYFGPWVPSLFIDIFLVQFGYGGPAVIIPWHAGIVGAEALLTAVGLMVLYGLPLKRALLLGLGSGAMFFSLAGLLMR
ncbi:MAG: hypothetical protein HQL53_06880 [Magnetococcales bacterium]|nr:hypothetical protein [Magnetococcales bacterium]